ncbi:hypothetical protein KM043_011537 [Ampulex compressa]|nr:hypothetical protein KM043_011537 [Ampulex compressa]
MTGPEFIPFSYDDDSSSYILPRSSDTIRADEPLNARGDVKLWTPEIREGSGPPANGNGRCQDERELRKLGSESLYYSCQVCSNHVRYFNKREQQGEARSHVLSSASLSHRFSLSLLPPAPHGSPPHEPTYIPAILSDTSPVPFTFISQRH